MNFRDTLRKYTPKFLLNWNRKRKKTNRNKALNDQKAKGESLNKQDLINDFKACGIKNSDIVLVHSALSKIGYLTDGPKTFVDALIDVVGENGHILMPTSPNPELQLNYIRKASCFDVLNSPSKLGKITEYFRLLPETERSLHPTEPVSVWGKNKLAFIDGHFKELTPYSKNSPYYKVGDKHGKILFIGVLLDSGTSLHTLEDEIVDFKYPVYYPEIMEIDVIDKIGDSHLVKTKVHNPEYSKLRKCNELIPHFEKAGVLKKTKIGEASTLVLDAKGMFDTMVSLYHKKGITMYTPNGEKLND